jgi:hypothetical protein
MKFNFRQFRNTDRKPLFIQLSSFSFASFLVPIKFRQPVPVNVFSTSSGRRDFRTYPSPRTRTRYEID